MKVQAVVIYISLFENQMCTAVVRGGGGFPGDCILYGGT